jgi:hypothetical protein
MRTLSLPPPCLSSSYSLHTNNKNNNFNFHLFSPNFTSSIKCFHFLTPHSSLKQTKKKPTKINNTNPSRLKRLFNPKGESDDDDNKNKKKKRGEESGKDEEEEDGGGTALKGTILAGVLLVGFVGGFASVGYFYREPINSFLNQFSGFIEGFFFLNLLHLCF